MLSHDQLFSIPWSVARQASLSITKSWSLLKLMSIKSAMLSNHLILHHPLLLLPSIFLSIRVFSTESVLHIMWPKYWSFSFNISPSNEYSGLISFRIDWFVLLAVQGTFKILPSLVAQLVKNSPAMQETLLPFLVGKICWRRDRLPTPVFLGFPGGLAGKESTCNAGDLGLIFGLERSPREGKGYPLQYSSLESPWTV